MTTSDPFASMAAALSGNAPAAREPVEVATSRTAHVAELLRAFDDPAAEWMASCLEQFLTRGGDLQGILGLRPPPGSAHLAPHRIGKRGLRDERLCELADSLTAGDKARALAELIQAAPPVVLALRAEVGVLPTSKAQCARILRLRSHVRR